MTEVCEAESSDPTERDERPRVSVVMPCLNEDRTVAACVQNALAALAELRLPGEVIVSDNGSEDNSVAAAEQVGARVVHCAERGYGSALRFGVEQSRGQFIVMGDCDGSYDFRSIGPFLDSLQKGAHLVMGNRFLGGIEPGAMPWKNRYLGNPLLTWILNLFFHVGIGDAHCGLRAFSREAFDRMQLECSGMEFASEMVVKAAKRGMRIVEVPTVLHHDGRGRPSHLLPWRDGWRHLKFLLMFSPLHLFLIPGVFLVVVGLLFLLLPAGGVFRVSGLHLDVHWMVLAVLLLVVGVQVVQFGVLARLYTVVHRFPEHDPPLEWLRAHFRIEYGILFGVCFFGLGFGIDSWVLWEWIQAGFGTLEKVRPAILATALMAVGVQFVFFSFLAEIMSTPAAKEPRGAEVNRHLLRKDSATPHVP
jgi:hypothetical protein